MIYAFSGIETFFIGLKINKIIDVIFGLVILYIGGEHNRIIFTDLSNDICERIICKFAG